MLDLLVWRARKIIVEMLRDRGYTHADMIPADSYKELNSYYNGDPKILYMHGYHQDYKIRIQFSSGNKVGIQSIRGMIKNSKNDDCKSLILIHRNNVTNPAKGELKKTAFPVELFDINELQVNITKHDLSPSYECLTVDQKNILLTKQKWNISDLPRLLRTDPICRYFAYPIGSVVKIRGSSVEGGIDTSFRVVV